MKQTVIHRFLDLDAKKDLLRFSTAGSVDDGKSTLIGRLLHDSKGVYDDQLDSIRGVSRVAGVLDGGIDFSLITDGLKAEREQGITIDVAYRYFSTPRRKFIIADTPGHEQYTRNMATGASTADLALILIDASQGVLIQSKRHAFIASLLGIPHMLVAVNKMDLVDYSQKVFDDIKVDFGNFAAKLGIKDIHFIPVSALKGDNIVEKSPNMDWHKGSPVLSYLEELYITSDRNLLDLRMPLQYVLRPDSSFRGYCSRIASGVVKKGDEVVALPSRKTSRIKSLVSYDGDLDAAFAPMSITFTLEDEIDISRGDMLSHKHNIPHSSRHFEAMLIWMDDKAMELGGTYVLKHGTRTCKAKLDGIRYRVDVGTLSRRQAEALELNDIGRVVLTANRPIFFDAYSRNRDTGSFILIDPVSNATSAAGMIIERESVEPIISDMHSESDKAPEDCGAVSIVTAQDRECAYNQKPVTIMLTGLHASGKSEIAYQLEKLLFDSGHASVVLTGRDLRSGISRELDFDISDRAENLRRAAETARILNSHGLICICAFIAPDSSIRRQMSDIVGKGRFIEAFVSLPLEECRKNDSTGLYRQADEGAVRDVAGVSYPYDEPKDSAIKLDMLSLTHHSAAEKILEYLKNLLIVS
ncbi:MAG: sulfate adenylyltransferase subunit CysN [Victivallales bacterium]|nr:sulfate adenylyltransferase subunit CysN [Victivallales bacterium]